MKYAAWTTALLISLAAATMASAQVVDDALSSDGGSWSPVDASTCSLGNITFVGGEEAIFYYGLNANPDGAAFYKFGGKILNTDGIGPANEAARFSPKFLGALSKGDGTLFVTHVFTTKDAPNDQKREACVFNKDKN